MRFVVQRVSGAGVAVEGESVGEIGPGLVVLAAVMEGDGREDLEAACEKLLHLRIFPNDDGKMDRSVIDIGGGILLVPQFTLAGDCRRGRRPDFTAAASPSGARTMYEDFAGMVRDRAAPHGVDVAEGRFGRMMDVSLVNDGPVTILYDSQGDF